MALTNNFCLAQDLIDRLTPAGVLYAADPTGQGAISDPIVQTQIAHAMQETNARINHALLPTLLPDNLPYRQDDPGDGSNMNPILRAWATNLGAYYLARVGGKGMTEIIIDDYNATLKELAVHAQRKTRLPGIVYPGDSYQQQRRNMGRPRLANTDERFRHGNLSERRIGSGGGSGPGGFGGPNRDG